MKKTLIFLMIFILISTNFSYAQLGFNLLRVPVLDQSAVTSLTSINAKLATLLTTLNAELQKLNLNIFNLLTNEINKEGTKLFSDIQAIIDYLKIRQDAEALLKKVKEKKIDNQEYIEKKISEAESAGFYNFLENLENIRCLPTYSRRAILSDVGNLAAKVDLLEQFKQKIVEIPDCERFSTTSPLVSLQKENLYLKFTKPFNLGSLLAQTVNRDNLLSEGFYLDFSSIKNHEANVLAQTAGFLFDREASAEIQKAVEEKREEIAKGPIYANCRKYIFTDNGKYICLDQEIIFDTQTLSKFLDSSSAFPPAFQDLDNFMVSNFTSAYINLLYTQLNIATPSLDFISEDVLSPSSSEKIIQQLCQKYDNEIKSTGASSETAESSEAIKKAPFIQCLKLLNNTFAEIASSSKIDLESNKKKMDEFRSLLGKVRGDVDNIINEMRFGSNSDVCRDALNELNDSVNNLNVQFNLSLSYSAELTSIQADILQKINQVDNLIRDMESLWNSITARLFGSIRFLNISIGAVFQMVASYVFRAIISWLGVENVLNGLRNLVTDIKDRALGEFLRAVQDKYPQLSRKWREANEKLAQVMNKINNFQNTLYNQGLTKSVINYNFFELQELKEKTEAYKKLIEQCQNDSQYHPACKCFKSGSSLSAATNFVIATETPTIVLENRKNKNFFIYHLTTFLKPKLVEINFK